MKTKRGSLVFSTVPENLGLGYHKNVTVNSIALVKLVHNNPWTWLLGKIVFFAKLWGIPTHIPNNQIPCWNWISLRPLLRDFLFFSLFHWNNENISKVAAGKSNLNKELIFCIWLFGMCVGMPQSLAKNTIFPSSQVQGLLRTSLTSAIELTDTFLLITKT